MNEEAVLPELYQRVIKGLATPIESQGDQVEIILIDDGSTDQSRKILKDLYKKDSDRIQIVFLSRNFGHQAAITAGMDLATGDTVTVLDADLQDPPEVVLEMISKFRDGFDVVYGLRKNRESEGIFKKMTAALFYRMLRSSTQLDIPLDTGDFRLMSRRAIHAMKSLRETHRFVRGLAKWVGYSQTSVSYVRQARFAGETKYPLKKMLRLAWDAFTGFSLLPLRIATYLGLFATLFSVAVGIWALYVRFFTPNAVQGWTSLMIAILFLGGAQLFTIGVLGEYVGRIFEESKKRPLYLVEDHLRK